MKSFILENVFRITVLSDDIVRVECNKEGNFIDENTFFIPHRDQFLGAPYSLSETEEEYRIELSGYQIRLKKGIASLNAITVESAVEKKTYRPMKNTGELPKVEKTPDFFFLMDSPHILLPKHGYSKESIQRAETYVIDESAQDLYILKCGKDHRKLRALYVSLTGRNELVSCSVLGSWNSKYYAYSEETAKELILKYESMNLPLDYMVIDTDWRSVTSHRGMGYDINTTLFPDMRRFLEFAHNHHVNIIFNDHPEPVSGAKNCLDPKEIAYREEKLKSLLELGLDSWWYDRNWITKLIAPTKKIAPETFGMYLFNDVTKSYHEAKKDETGGVLRDDMMSNINEVENGKYRRIKDSASHRFGVEWTGDTESTEFSLAQEVADLIRCSENCIPYTSSDIGGHIGNPEKDLYLRWMEFGCFSPIMRPHCTNSVTRFREPWNYDEETVNVVRSYLNMRYHLLPLFYSRAFQSYQNGEPICTSLSYRYPDDKKTYTAENSYMIGSEILVSPVSIEKYTNLSPSNYLGKVHVDYYNGRELEGPVIASEELDKIDFTIEPDVKKTLHPDVPQFEFSARYRFKLRFDHDVTLLTYSDDGIRVFVDGKKVYEDWSCHAPSPTKSGLISKGVHDVVIEYFQAGGRQALKLFKLRAQKEGYLKNYLPKGQWLSVFDGVIYEGGQRLCRFYEAKHLPVFVRLGSMIPLAETASNTKVQSWKTIAFDLYPSKEQSSEFFLYEDDGTTKNYQSGAYRKTDYQFAFDAKRNAYCIHLSQAQGPYQGREGYSTRHVVLRFHKLFAEDQIAGVSVNGTSIDYSISPRQAGCDPFGFECQHAPDSDLVIAEFDHDLNQDVEVLISLQ